MAMCSVVTAAILVAMATAMMAQSSTADQSGTPSGASKPPELTEIIPSSGPSGQAYPLQATIHGTGFMPTGNIIEFGPIRIADVPSIEANRIAFAIPKTVPSRGEVPPLVLPPGEYRVTVSTKVGTSNALMFTLIRGP